MICTSSFGTTFSKNLRDGNAETSPTSFSIDFTATDGVEPGTPYECAVTMTIQNGQVSGKSEAAVFSTLDTGIHTILLIHKMLFDLIPCLNIHRQKLY